MNLIEKDWETDMLTIGKKQDGSALTFSLKGRLDTTTSPQLEAELRSGLDGVEDLAFDMAALEYISSACLRVLLSAQKAMTRQGSMTIRNVNPDVMEVFEVTGFVDILNIE